MPSLSRVPPRRPDLSHWTFGRKFTLWLADHGLSLNAFAEREGIPQSTLHGWVKKGVKVPSDRLADIARATGLPVDYWSNPRAPYPPAVEYENAAEEILRRAKSLTADQLREIVAMLGDPADVARTLALRRASGHGK